MIKIIIQTALAFLLINSSICLFEEPVNKDVSLTHTARVIEDLMEAREDETSEEEQGIYPLLNEIKGLLIKTQTPIEERWENRYGTLKDGIKSDLDRVHGQLDALSTRISQGLDVFLQSFSSVGVHVTSEMKKTEDMLERLQRLEEKMHQTIINKEDESKEVEDLDDYNETAIGVDSLRVPAIDSRRIVEILSATIPRWPQLISLEEIHKHSMEVTENENDSGTSETQEDETAPIASNRERQTLLRSRSELVETNTKHDNDSLPSNTESQIKLELEDLKQQLESLKNDSEINNNNYYDELQTKNMNLEWEITELKQMHSQFDPLLWEVEALKIDVQFLGNTVTTLNKIVNDNADFLNQTVNGISELEGRTASIDEPGLCVWPYTRAAGSCLSVSQDQRLSWSDARDHCKSIQGDLAAPKDFKLFTEFLVSQKLSRSYSYWIGGSDTETEDTWVWVDGSPIPMGTEVWATNQPNEGKSANCLGVKITTRGTGASDEECWGTNFFVCEQERKV